MVVSLICDAEGRLVEKIQPARVRCFDQAEAALLSGKSALSEVSSHASSASNIQL
jgi:hypothetical protein